MLTNPTLSAFRSRLGPPALTALVALAVACWGLTAPSFWRDEAVTADLTGRTVPQLLRVLGEIDAVHGFYYLLMWPVTTVFGVSELTLRLPSALAAAAAAGLTTALGRRLATTRLGITAGLLVAVSPFLSRYAQEARQYAMVAALAVLATWLLVRAEDRRGWAWYAVSVVLLGYTHLFALLLLPAHVIARRDALRAWAAAAGAALVPLLALVVFAQTQRYQVSWIEPVTAKGMVRLAQALGWGPFLLAPAVLLLALALWRYRPASPLLRVALPWLVLPPVLLVGVSLVGSPYYVQRYLLYCVPAAALLVAAGLETLSWKLAVPLVVAAAAATVPVHLDQRRQDGRVDDLRALAEIVAEHKRPGDAILFTDVRMRPALSVYPSAYRGLDDVMRRATPVAAGDLKGREVSRAGYAEALAGTDRVWLLANRVPFLPGSDWTAGAKRRVLREAGFEEARDWRYKGGRVLLYRRAPSAGGPVDVLPKRAAQSDLAG
ncbi:glycosyltransferase family 39 protein [Actinocorallia populi]|uniref:glycosyltransferase family 39 protein n=1 Tax=Actinocorallia populi TaxID=2079200 RepID=UPI000D088A38|nr:glycosyltransferase family 39 protein [Actinocorallia populi]